MAAFKSISIIIRTTEACNLSCKYCYVKPITQNTVFPLDLFDRLLRELAELNYRRVVLYWHGGEPLLARVEYYQEAVRIEQKVFKECGLCVANKMVSAPNRWDRHNATGTAKGSTWCFCQYRSQPPLSNRVRRAAKALLVCSLQCMP